ALGISAACAPASGPSGPAAGTAPPAPAPTERNEPVKIGYLPITDASALLLAHARGLYAEEGLQAETVLFRGWSQIAEAFMARQVNVAHLLMPMTVWMRHALHYPVKVVAWAHTNGSALTVAKDVGTYADLRGKTVAVPFWYSIHNVVLQLGLAKAGVKPILPAEGGADGVKLVVMAPPDMPAALANRSIAGYIVAEPFNAAGEVLAGGKILRFTGDVWKDHACCVVVMHEEDLRERPEWSRRVLTAVVKAQRWARENTAEAARLLSKDGKGYIALGADVVTRAMTHYDLAEYGPSGAIRHADWGARRLAFQPFPYPSYTSELVRRLRTTKVEGDRAFLEALDPAFAARDLVDERPVRLAYEASGGPTAFGVETARAFTREEVIDV
ncbi:MAG: ABC transporter substrate-binding protein, partial [Chloroflexi bacterium]|nr:ABC transporter substrate-binding protein [Chloroflexota bacterium]